LQTYIQAAHAVERKGGVTLIRTDEKAMTAMSTSLIRWHYLWYVTAALAVMVAVIVNHDLWALNFLHVFCGLL